MDETQAAKLRQPFPKEAIGRLPKGGAWLDYVGHAATTDRLLSVDPAWTWEPVAFDDRGLPRLDESGGLWIRLTVCGVTRIGYGDSGGKKGPNAVKEAIGDALRNAAMRFGVALDLWAKEDLSAMHQAADQAPQPAAPISQQPARPAVSDEKQDDINRSKRRVKTLGEKLGMDLTALAAEFNSFTDGGELRSAGALQLASFGDYLEHQAKASNGAVSA